MTSGVALKNSVRVAVGLPVLFGALDLTVMSATLPIIISELDLVMPAGARQAAWLVSGYLLAYAVGILIAGRLADQIGERLVLTGALILFGAASVIVAISGDWSADLVRNVAYRIAEARPDAGLVNLGILIGGRALQALGAGAIVPVGMALGWRVTKERSWLGFIAAIDMAGWTLGHLYGGIIVGLSNWRVAFWINVPLVALALVGLRKLPQDRGEREGKLPYVPILLASLGLITLLVGLGGDSQAALQPTWIVVGIGLLIGSALTGVSELLPIGIAKMRPAAAAANLMLGFSVFLTLAFVPLFITTLIESDPQKAAWSTGWMLTLYTAPLVVGAWVGSRWIASIVPGAVGVWAGFAMIGGWEPSYTSMAPGLIVLGLSIGTFFAPLAEELISAAPMAQAGGASSFVILSRLVGMAVGTAILTQTVTATLSAGSDLSAALLPAFHGAARLGWWGAAFLTAYAAKALAARLITR